MFHDFLSKSMTSRCLFLGLLETLHTSENIQKEDPLVLTIKYRGGREGDFTKILSPNCKVTIGKRNNSQTIQMQQNNLYKQRNLHKKIHT
jgi:hypothetical protein